MAVSMRYRRDHGENGKYRRGERLVPAEGPSAVTNTSTRMPPPSGGGGSAYGWNLRPSRAERMSGTRLRNRRMRGGRAPGQGRLDVPVADVTLDDKRHHRDGAGQQHGHRRPGGQPQPAGQRERHQRSEEHTSELQ